MILKNQVFFRPIRVIASFLETLNVFVHFSFLKTLEKEFILSIQKILITDLGILYSIIIKRKTLTFNLTTNTREFLPIYSKKKMTHQGENTKECQYRRQNAFRHPGNTITETFSGAASTLDI